MWAGSCGDAKNSVRSLDTEESVVRGAEGKSPASDVGERSMVVKGQSKAWGGVCEEVGAVSL